MNKTVPIRFLFYSLGYSIFLLTLASAVSAKPATLVGRSFSTTGQATEFQSISSDRVKDFRLRFKLEQVSGVWGIVFCRLDNQNFCLVNFYPEKKTIYYYRIVKGSFIEVSHFDWQGDKNAIELEKSGHNIVVRNSGQQFQLDEPYFVAGGIGLRTENSATTMTITEYEETAVLSEQKTLFLEEAFLEQYLPKREKTMLFYDFSKQPDDFHFCQIRGETECDWEEGHLVFSFPRQFETWMVFHKDISGYAGIVLEGEFSSAGDVRIEIVDIFDRQFVWKGKVQEDQTQIRLAFSEFENEEAPTPASLETLRIHFTPTGDEKEHRYRLRKIYPFGGDPMSGPWTAVDPLFAYYKFSPWPRTAKELKNLGFVGAQIILIKDEPGIEQQRKIVEAFHQEGLLCVLSIFPTTDFNAYNDHPDWRQLTLDGSSRHDWRVYLCPNSEAFAEYLCEKIDTILQAVPYDAIELSEPWFEVWGGPYPQNPQRGKYACLCKNCRQKFQGIAGVDPKSLFDEADKLYFLKPENHSIYQKWVDFRVDTVIEFSRKIYARARQARPEIKIVHMHLSDCTVEPGKSREYQAQDFEKAIRVLNPDAMIIQDAWQDWTRPETQPDFVIAYGDYYLGRIHKASPQIKVFAHADIGSLAEMQRSSSWMRQFSAHARRIGFDGVSYYEFSIGDFSK